MKHRYDALLSRAWRCQDELQTMALYEEAIVIADRYLTESDAHRARMDYTDKAVEYGFYDKMLVSFAWCWTKFVEHPERYSSFYMLWHFKWVVEDLPKCAIYSIEQLERLFALFKEYCEKHNYSLRPYYEAYMHFRLGSGNLAEADEHYRLWRKAKRDGLSNCQACEQHAMGEYYIAKGHYKRGLQLLKPILEGKLTCRSVPKSTYIIVMEAHLALGQLEEAMKYAGKAYRSLKGVGDLGKYGKLIGFYAVTNRRRALKMYRETFRFARLNVNDWARLHYLAGVQFLLEQLGEDAKRRRKASPAGLDYAWVRSEAERLAKAFDERNQNGYVSGRIEGLRRNFEKLKKLALAAETARRQAESGEL